MTISTVALPLTTKLDREITKKVSFKVKRSKANNNYVQTLVNGLASNSHTLSLTYRALTDAEVTQVEAVFLQQALDKYVTFQPPTATTTKVYKIPLTWDKERFITYKPTMGYRTDLSFQLISLY